MPTRPSLLVIRAADLGASRTVYEDGLGLSFQVETHGSGSEHLACAFEGCVVEIYPRRSGTDSTSAVRIGFEVEALGAILSRIAAVGGEVISEPLESEWGPPHRRP